MESLPAVDVFGARLSSSLGIRTRLASRGSLVSFLRAAIAALRRASSGSFGQFGAFTSFEAAAGGGRSSLGGTTSGDRSRYSMPRLSMLVPPMPAMIPSMTFSSKVLSSSSSSWARAAPAVITRPIPSAMTASRSARLSASDEFRTIQPLASVLRIALFLFKNFLRAPIAGASSHPGKQDPALVGSYQPGSGRFCGGYPQEGIIQQGRYPGNNRDVGKVKHVPIEGLAPDLEVKQGEIDYRAIGEAVDGVADGAADDQAERDGGGQGARACHPDREDNHRHRLDDHQDDLGALVVALKPAEADPDIPCQHQVEKRRDLHRAAVGEVEHVKQPEF